MIAHQGTFQIGPIRIESYFVALLRSSVFEEVISESKPHVISLGSGPLGGIGVAARIYFRFQPIHHYGLVIYGGMANAYRIQMFTKNETKYYNKIRVSVRNISN